MSRSDTKRLDDIREMCDRAARLVARGRDAVEADADLWLALERMVEIAGEAAAQLSHDARTRYPTAEWRQLIAVRVRLAHAYFRIDQDILWEIATVDLPELSDAIGPIDPNDKS